MLVMVLFYTYYVFVMSHIFFCISELPDFSKSFKFEMLFAYIWSNLFIFAYIWIYIECSCNYLFFNANLRNIQRIQVYLYYVSNPLGMGAVEMVLPVLSRTHVPIRPICYHADLRICLFVFSQFLRRMLLIHLLYLLFIISHLLVMIIERII